jgi:flagellar hook-associated protein 1 FlgK
LTTKFAPQGFWLQIASGAAQVGDSFLIRPTRNAARDIGMAVSDPRDVALAQGFRTATAVTNSGTGAISGGSVVKTNAPLSAPVALKYEAASNSLTGFPVGSSVLVGTTTYSIASEAQRVPYVAGYNYSFGGTGFTLTGAPSNGDVFIVNPPPGAPTAGNGGLTALFGTPVAAPPAATGSVAPATATSPFRVMAGSNDKFDIAVDGASAVTITLPEGNYTPAALAAEMQVRINAAVALPGVTVTVDVADQLVVTSLNGAGSVALSATSPNLGSGIVAAGAATSTSSMPAAPLTLTYRQADSAAGLPARLTGFPAGTTVTVTLPNGSAREYAINSADGFTDAAAFADHVEFSDGATIEFNGMRFVSSGNPANGDSFTIGPNTSATGDNRNVLAIGAMQLANGLGDGTASFQSAYSRMVSLVGNKTREVDVTLTAQENLVTQGQTAMQSISGVNLDEEAANLMRYQQAYQAAAKMLDMSNKLFDLITGLGR